jgi:hypothetical protein
VDVVKVGKKGEKDSVGKETVLRVGKGNRVG